MKLEQVKEVYFQEGDCYDSRDQFVKLSTHDGGGGPYITIETERWAINPEDIDAFAQKMKDLIVRVEQANDSSGDK